jgi:hypothetical protein
VFIDLASSEVLSVIRISVVPLFTLSEGNRVPESSEESAQSDDFKGEMRETTVDGVQENCYI